MRVLTTVCILQIHFRAIVHQIDVNASITLSNSDEVDQNLFVWRLHFHLCACRQEATYETTLFPTLSSSSQTAWRCMPTQFRDFTKHCWMTFHRSEWFCSSMWSDLKRSISESKGNLVVFSLHSLATSCAGCIMVHRRVWRSAGVRAVWGRRAHPGTTEKNPAHKDDWTEDYVFSSKKSLDLVSSFYISFTPFF